MAFKSPLVDGLVEDWDAIAGLIEHAGRDRFASATGRSSSVSSVTEDDGAGALMSSPFALAEHVYASRADREKWAELLFETYHVPAFFAARGGVLVLFANARTTGIAVDGGAGGTTITPVQEGYALMSGARVHAVGGRALDGALAAALAEKNVPLSSSAWRATLPAPPQLPAGVATWHPSVTLWHEMERARLIKETMCRVRDSPFGSVGAGQGVTGSASSGPGTSSAAPSHSTNLRAVEAFVLPDGTHVNIDSVCSAVPEAIFGGGTELDGSSTANGSGSGAGGLHSAIVSAAMACDAHVRRDLVGNLVLAGGASALPGFSERLAREFAPLAPVGTRPRWAAASPSERQLSAWIGGSIVASLGTFPELWFSAEDYREYGAAFMHKRCP